MRCRAAATALLAASLSILAGCQTDQGNGREPQLRTSTTRSPDEQSEGASRYRLITSGYSIYDDPKIAAYVDRVGQRLARVSEQPGAPWTFTVLDTPSVSAFATVGGYIYITRGLLALAGDEAQLAGVIGHEIGHVTADHMARRRERDTAMALLITFGMVGLAILGADPSMVNNAMNIGAPVGSGLLASYSRGDELEADNLAIRYMVRAGYDPYAQADFLKRITASRDLQQRIARTNYDASRVDFFASHPSNAPRIRQAIQTAQQATTTTKGEMVRNRDQFLAMLDGMVFGPRSTQGFVDGRIFRHPKLGITFTAPPQFTISNITRAVIARGPKGARFIVDSAAERDGPLTDYIRRVWVPSINAMVRPGELTGVQEREVNGLAAATAILPVEDDKGAQDALLAAFRLDGRIYRIIGLAPRGSNLLPDLQAAARTFRRLTADEAAELRELRIEIAPAEGTVLDMAQRMNFGDHQVERFLVLNGLTPDDVPGPGRPVKLVR